MSKVAFNKFLPIFILTTGVILSIFLSYTINNLISSIEKQRFETATKQIESEINTNKHLLSILIKSIANTFVVSDYVSEKDFEKIVQTISLQQNPFGIQMLGYATFVKNQDKSEFEKNNNLQIHPQTNNDAFPIIYQEPKRLDLAGAYGYDPFTNLPRKKAMQKAMNSKDISMTSVVTFEFTGDKNSGLIYYYPIFKDEKLDGFIYVGVDIAQFYNLALVKAYINCDFEIYSTQEGPKKLLYDTNPSLQSAKYQKVSHFLHNDRSRLALFKSDTILNLGALKYIDMFLLVIGIFISILTSITVRNLLRTKLNALAMASNMTKTFKSRFIHLKKAYFIFHLMKI